MTVADLIERLADYPQGAEVRLATQPSWPLAFTVAGVVSNTDLHPDPDELGWDEPDEDGYLPGGPGSDTRHQDGDDGLEIVWVVEGGHPQGFGESPYAPRGVFEQV